MLGSCKLIDVPPPPPFMDVRAITEVKVDVREECEHMAGYWLWDRASYIDITPGSLARALQARISPLVELC